MSKMKELLDAIVVLLDEASYAQKLLVGFYGSDSEELKAAIEGVKKLMPPEPSEGLGELEEGE